MRVVAGAALMALISTAAAAQVTGEPRSVNQANGNISVAVNVTAQSDLKLIIVGATLVDSTGQTFQLGGNTTGIQWSTRSACQIGQTLPAGMKKLVTIPFKGNGTAPFTVSIEFETPDRKEMFGCKSFSVDIEGLK